MDMNIKNTSRQGVAAGLASIIVAGGTMILPVAAVADHNDGSGGGPVATRVALDIDDKVALRKNAMYRAWARRS